MNLPDVIVEERVIPVARGLDASTAPRLVTALRAGGLNSIEVTVEGRSGMEAIEAIANGPSLVGAGTVVTAAQAEEAVEAGARFLVSPHFDLELIEWARDNQVPYIPGALTPTEVFAAWTREPAAVKVFPAHVGGPGYLRSLLGPFPDLTLVPTGGVSADNMAGFLSAGAVAVGVGGWLTGGSDYDEISRRSSVLRSQTKS